ncbi:hypothetical protein FHX08_006345 [Rhizobium sp. BK529]|uniref:hypothetical protein n=1 Tax=Rhizobium sp. BK529 TaxID=2586983 RepID=UPI00160F9C27|nr:hypothetical protein [Rhizobium sp. BK529]MBB3595925.1 hypothetical protein [Rhizobium sp. BK529]
MMTSLIMDIQYAQVRLSSLTKRERRTIIMRIIRELMHHRQGALRDAPADDCVSIDSLIVSMSATIAEIAEMEETFLKRVLHEAEGLIATLTTISEARSVATIH